MKVNRAPTPFQPLVITVETPEELQHLRNIFGHNSTIPLSIHPSDSSARKALSEFMGDVYPGLTK